MHIAASFFFHHWIFHPLYGRGYQFWSGIAGCFVSIGFLGGLIAYLRKHNCHVKGCPRLARHPVEGTPYVTCKRHHPNVPDNVTVEHIHKLHKGANGISA